MKKPLFLILYLLACLLLVALLLEVGLRWIHYQKTSAHDFAIKEVLRNFREGVKASRLPPSPELERFVASEKEVRDLYPAFKKDAIAFGNSPFIELIQPETESIIRDKDGVLGNLPSHTYQVAFGRYRIGDPWDPVLFKDNHLEKPNSPETEAFVKARLFTPTTASHDELGHRNTVPASTAQDIVLVMGDSVAYGAAVNDHETLASQLQLLHPSVRFINCGVGGSGTPDNLRRLDLELKRYGSQVKSVIYVHCENDWNDDDTPEKLASGLTSALDAAGIQDRVMIYTEYLERAMPDLLREPKESDFRRFMHLKSRTFSLLKDSRITLIDWWQLLDTYRQREGSVFSGMALYVDHCHLSPLGLSVLAKSVPVFGESMKK